MGFFTTSDNVGLYYETKGEGLPIIFIHGFTEDHNSFKIQQKVLSRGYKIITWDLRGHGISDKVDYGLNMERLAYDLRELIDYLELEEVIVVGWSMGASVIFEYINLFGEEKLCKVCIIDKGPKIINDNNWNLGLYHGQYTVEDSLRDLDLIRDNWMEFTEKFIKNMAPYFSKRQFTISIDKMRKNSSYIMYYMWKAIAEKDYRHILEKISIPTLIIFGEKSTLYSVEVGKYLKENIKNSELTIFENCTHLLVFENPVKFNRVLEEFINNKNHNL